MGHHDPGRDRPDGDSSIHWFEGLVASFLLECLIFSLYFLVPKLAVNWMKLGVRPPPWGRLLISMMSYLEIVVIGGLVLVVLSFRRRL
jgi:hypothetical protein